MLLSKKLIPVILLGLTVTACGSTQKVQDSTSAVIFTSVPLPKQTVLVPIGYRHCFTVTEGFYKDRWASSHRVCEYTHEKGQSRWVDGYWMCKKSDMRYNWDIKKSVCTNWQWIPNHTTETTVNY